MKKVFLFLSLFFLFFVTVYSIKAAVISDKFTSQADLIPNQYIVVFKDNIGDSQSATSDLEKKHGFSSEHVYKNILKGFSARLSTLGLEKIKEDPRVRFIAQDREVRYQVIGEATPRFTFGRPRLTPTPLPQTTPAGVSRIGINNTNQGAGVGVAVIDTGIDLTHPDLKDNIVANTTCISRTTTGNDDNGHGSHVAGTIAAENNSIGVVGVAPQAKLLAVKVLNSQGSGTWSSVICGIDWVTVNAAKYNIKVANMSLGGSGSSDNNCGNSNNDPLHLAICRSRDAGVTYVVAAGNSGTNASGMVPAAYDDAVITVSALVDSDGKAGGLGPVTWYGPDDTFATFSNYGSIVDLGGPGVNIYSTYKGGGYATLSGTSMATPHVTAAAALYIKSNPGSSWIKVREGLKAAGELLNSDHTDPSGLHPEPVVKASSL